MILLGISPVGRGKEQEDGMGKKLVRDTPDTTHTWLGTGLADQGIMTIFTPNFRLAPEPLSFLPLSSLPMSCTLRSNQMERRENGRESTRD